MKLWHNWRHISLNILRQCCWKKWIFHLNSKCIIQILLFEWYLHCFLICTLISENQGLLQTFENFRSCSPDFFSVLPLDFFQIYGINLEKKSSLQDLKFFYGLKQTLIFQDLDFLKSRCRLKGHLFIQFMLDLVHAYNSMGEN